MEIYIIKKLKRQIIALLKLLERINLSLNFFVKKKKKVDVDVCYPVLKVKTPSLIFLKLKINFQNKGTKLMK